MGLCRALRSAVGKTLAMFPILLLLAISGCGASRVNSVPDQSAAVDSRPPLSIAEEAYRACTGGRWSACERLAVQDRNSWHLLSFQQRVEVGRTMCALNRAACPFYGRLLVNAWRIDEARETCAGTCLAQLPEGCYCEAQIAQVDLDLLGALSFHEKGCAMGDQNACLGVGGVKSMMADYEGAASTYRRLCGQGNVYACQALGGIQFHQEDFEGATASFQKAVAGGIHEANVGIANVRFAQGDLIETRGLLTAECYTKRFPPACVNLAFLELREGRWDGMGTHLAEACSLDRQFCGSAGWHLIASGKGTRAEGVSKYRTACEADNQFACVGLAASEAFFGNTDEGVRIARQSCRRNIWSGCALEATLTEAIGDTEPLVAKLARLCERSQGGACSALSDIHEAGGRDREAERVAKRACTLSRSSCGNYGYFLVKRGERMRGAREFRRACVHGEWTNCIFADFLTRNDSIVSARTQKETLDRLCRASVFPDRSAPCLLLRKVR